MKDDESTQPIDVAALRAAASQSKPSTEKTPLLEPLEGEDDELRTVARQSRPSYPEPPTDDPSSVTKLDIAPPVDLPDDHATTGPQPAPSWMTHRDAVFGLPEPLAAEREPGTMPAHSIIKAMVAEMGSVPSMLGALPEDDIEEVEAIDDVEDLEELETQTKIPMPTKKQVRPPPSLMVDSGSQEVTSVALPDPSDVSGPHSAITMQIQQGLTYQAAPEHPADETESTQMGRMDRADIQAAFAAADAAELAATKPSIAEEDRPPPISSLSSIPIAIIEEGNPDDLESEPEIEDLDATGALPRFALPSQDEIEQEDEPATAARIRRPSQEEILLSSNTPYQNERALANVTITDVTKVQSSEGEIVLSVAHSDVEVFSQPHSDVEILSGNSDVELLDDDVVDDDDRIEPIEEDEDDGGQTAVNLEKKKPPAAAAPKRTAPPRDYVPPNIVVRPIVPAYAVDPDDDEKQLQDEGGWHALVDLYRLRLHDANGRAQRVSLLHRLASVYEHGLEDPTSAFGELVTGFDLDPTDAPLMESLDRVARVLGRIGELAERARKNLHTADQETRVTILGYLVHWYERVLGRGGEISAFLSEIERLDKSHPAALRRAAQIALANGDAKTHRDLLLRALDRVTLKDEKVHLNLALASAYSGMPEATKHYEAVLAIDPGSIVALQGIERIGREHEKHGQVEWALERQAEMAPTASEKVDALSRLAELEEVKFLRRERAAELYEDVLGLEPANPIAMKALERCYHALRDWPRLARILRIRAENTYDKKVQAELLLLAAEVLESKLGDSAQAIEVYRDLLHVDPKHRRALSDLARLSEKLGDWANVAQYKGKLAEQASTKRQQSRELVQLGDFLVAPERDPIAARLQYERAVSVDPTNAQAWEALQRVAQAAGDDRRAAQCLFERAKNTDAPRARAMVYVELANLEQQRGDLRAAREAYEQAVGADPSNEQAAAAMLDTFTREERWAEAAPLCELLVNAAVRDKDNDALFTRLRLSTRIAAALGDPERAMTSALAALDAHPDDAGARADLVAVCSQCREAPRVVARAKARLTQIAASAFELPADVLLRLAQLQRDDSELDAAVATLERARAQDPDNVEVAREMSDCLLALGEFGGACALLVELAQNAMSADARFKLLVDAGEIWAKKAHELETAAPIFEEARRVKPTDSWLLHNLMWLYGELSDWERLADVVASIAEIQDTPEKKAKSVFTLAQLVREKIGDYARAADLFDDVLDIDRKRLDVFEELVRTLTSAKAWDRLDLAYRKMIARIKDDEGEGNLRFALFQQLGIVYRDLLEDASRAYEALDAAARIRPDDTGVRKMVHELLVVTDNLDNAVARTRELMDREPHDPELYAELYDLFLRQHYFDKAWCAVNVLAQQRALTPDQQQFHEDYAPMLLSDIPGQIVEQAWQSHLLHVDLDRTLTNIFGLMTPAVARMRYAQLRPDQLVHAAGRPFTPKHSRLHDQIRATFANAAEILGAPIPELLLGDASAPLPFSPALAPFGALLVHVPAVEARADSLVYMAGRRLAEQRNELTARAFFPSVPDLTMLLAAAVRVARAEGAKDAAGAALDAALAAMMTPDERNGIRSIVMQAQMEGGLVDVKRWSQAADLSSMRAGLLLAGDVEPARKSILAEPLSAADLPPRERVGELYKFATSDLYSDLRGAIGVAVQE